MPSTARRRSEERSDAPPQRTSAWALRPSIMPSSCQAASAASSMRSRMIGRSVPADSSRARRVELGLRPRPARLIASSALAGSVPMFATTSSAPRPPGHLVRRDQRTTTRPAKGPAAWRRGSADLAVNQPAHLDRALFPRDREHVLPADPFGIPAGGGSCPPDFLYTTTFGLRPFFEAGSHCRRGWPPRRRAREPFVGRCQRGSAAIAFRPAPDRPPRRRR